MMIGFISVLAPLLIAQASDVAVPPAPDFVTRIDYVQWFRDQLKFADADNAYDQYRHFLIAGQRLTAPENVDKQLGAVLDASRPWKSDEHPQLAAWLTKHASVLEAYRRGTEHEFYAWAETSAARSLYEITLPGLGASRLLSKAVLAAAWRADDDFEGTEFVTGLAVVIRHANHLSQGLTSIEHLVAVGIKVQVYAQILQAMRGELLSASQLKALQSVLKELDAQNLGRGIRRGLPFEQANAYDLIQSMCIVNARLQNTYSASSEGLQQLRVVDPATATRINPRNLANEDPGATCRHVQRFFDEFIAAIGWDLPKNVEDLIAPKYETAAKSSEILRVVLPNLEKMCSLTMIAETRRRGVQVLLALKIHEQQQGRWPAKLSDPLLKLPRSIRRDPRSAKNFIYKVEERQMMLYSVGKDRADNGGVQFKAKYEDRDGEDLIIWPTPTWRP